MEDANVSPPEMEPVLSIGEFLEIFNTREDYRSPHHIQIRNAYILTYKKQLALALEYVRNYYDLRFCVKCSKFRVRDPFSYTPRLSNSIAVEKPPLQTVQELRAEDGPSLPVGYQLHWVFQS